MTMRPLSPHLRTEIVRWRRCLPDGGGFAFVMLIILSPVLWVLVIQLIAHIVSGAVACDPMTPPLWRC